MTNQSPAPDLELRLGDLRRHYMAQLVAKVAHIDTLWQVAEASHWDAQRLVELRRLVHSMAGSGSSYGLPAVSAAASSLEALLVELPAWPAPAQGAQVSALLSQLRSIAADPVIVNPADEPSAWVYVVASDGGQELAAQLGNFGYAAVGVANLATLAALVERQPADAVVIDLALAPPAEAVALLAGSAIRPPVIFTAQRGDFAARLEVTRAGGSAFFTYPVDVGALVDQLDTLTERQGPEPFRVLIVDDSALSARYHAAILRAAGMKVAAATDPATVPAMLAEFQPDLVLMDVYMAGCDGHELAAVIRQQPAFHSMPIVFLSSETDRSAQLHALDQGGDDFLTKPIRPEHLTLAVRSRASRARVMRSQMVRDGLTGLFNHSVTKEHLAREVARARRSQNPLAFALIDLDHFKLVNDTYGHAAGDRVLKSLARLLLQRLRASDVIGRFGGEEFAVILPETDAPAAIAVIDALRARFAQIHHRGGEGEFNVSFSAGVALLSAGADAAALNESADVALYQAKRHGRNQVVLAPPERASAESPAAGPFRPPRPAPPADAPTVLVVDDDPDMRALLVAWIGAAGMRVRAAAGGAEALAMIDADPPDLVLLDMLMPEVSGLDVLDQIRSGKRDLAVVMTTAFGSEQIAVSAIRRGADDYLRKPIDPAELRTVLDRTLAHLQLRRQNADLRRQLAAARRDGV